MIRIHMLLIGQPKTMTDEQGTWRSAIFRTPVDGPIALEQRGLAGDQVGDPKNHGSPDQAVCCHPLAHYAYWNKIYQLDMPETRLGPGSVGENWTLSDVTEADICIGDIFSVGGAQVQVTGPRVPCWKQDRKLKLSDFQKRTLETLRTGFYVRVLKPGLVQAGDAWMLEERPHSDLTIHALNVCAHQTFDPVLAQRLVEAPELGASWKHRLSARLAKETG
jgi:MOSC domain-containing protein YiiM